MRTHANHDDFLCFVLAQLGGMPTVTARRMFGAWGLYQDTCFFGILSDGRLYFKTDEQTRAPYIAAGMGPFIASERQVLKNYYEVPVSVLEDADTLVAWAWDAVRLNGSPSPKVPAKNRRTGKMRNIGPASQAWLAQIGIHTLNDLAAAGVEQTFLALKAQGRHVTLNLAYALQGALLDLDWRELPADVKANLRQKLGSRLSGEICQASHSL